MSKRIVAGVALIMAGLCGAAYAFWPIVLPRDNSRIEWADDFLSARLNPAYTVVPLPGMGEILATDRAGGWVHLRANNGLEMARFRLGDDPRDTHGVELNMPFDARALPVGRTRVSVDTADNADVTIGFVGPDDPNGVAGALIYRDGTAHGVQNRGWWLQTCAEAQCTTTLLRDADGAVFVHHPNKAFEVEISLMPGRAQACAIDGSMRFCANNTTHVPEGGAAWEYQIWTTNGAEPATMAVDYLNITQKRDN